MMDLARYYRLSLKSLAVKASFGTILTGSMASISSTKNNRNDTKTTQRKSA
jgi:hypothetical protein